MRKHNRVAGILLILFLILAEGVFVAAAVYSGLVPKKFRIPGIAVLVVLTVVCAILLWSTRNRIRYTAGLILWFAAIAALLLAGIWIFRFKQKVSDIMDSDTEIVKMSVYVRADDAAAGVSNTAGYAYGILTTLDRENTDAFLVQLEAETGEDFSVKEYQGLMQLVDSLRGKETDAIVLNSAFMDVVREMEGYESVDSELRLLTERNLEYKVEASKAGGTSVSEAQNTDAGEELTSGTTAGPAQNASSGLYGNETEDVYTIYISGIDSRDGLVARSRTDSNILAVANMNTRQALILSTPRDYYVPLSISGGVRDKLTHAGIYGIQVSMDTMSMLYETAIPYYVRVNFEGFTDIIDLLGGITVESDYEFDSKNILGYHFNQGANQMNGEEALVFARERFSFAEGDRQRGRNQMAVIEGVLGKLDSSDVLTNFSKYLDALEGSFETNISYEMISGIVQEVIGNTDGWEVYTYSVNGTEGNEIPYSLTTPVYVMIPDESTVEHAKELINKVKAGERLTNADVMTEEELAAEAAAAAAAEEITAE